MAQVSLNKTFNQVHNTKSITATTTLKNTDSGKILLLDGSSEANITITLPSVEAGLVFEAVCIAASHANSEILFDAGSGVTIKGISSEVAATNLGGGVGGNQLDVISAQGLGFADATILGSRLKIVCDGTGWFVLYAEASPAMITSIS